MNWNSHLVGVRVWRLCVFSQRVSCSVIRDNNLNKENYTESPCRSRRLPTTLVNLEGPSGSQSSTSVHFPTIKIIPKILCPKRYVYQFKPINTMFDEWYTMFIKHYVCTGGREKGLWIQLRFVGTFWDTEYRSIKGRTLKQSTEFPITVTMQINDIRDTLAN